MPMVKTMRIVHDLVRTLRWHRRLLAALIAGVATLVALTAVSRPAAGLETTAVVVAQRLIPAGSTITADDLRLVDLPVMAIPESALRDPAAAVGRLVGTGIPRGQVLTEQNLVISNPSAGRLVVGVRISDPDLARLAPPGTRVTLFAAGSPEPVVSQVLVRASPGPSDPGPGSRSGLLLVETDIAQAAAIATASSQTTLTVAIG